MLSSQTVLKPMFHVSNVFFKKTKKKKPFLAVNVT